ncbi:hypothetical protein IF1G_00303 [Cordyceps javanica]|uniref:Uncharacterized protein n=1 Tax=Cordyceps javanica TaxID=43265 RepID=A0A545VF77_9HYPO|nr:hypothetical protein IF1G_00303 [Cordyceps javanica]
MGKQEQGLQVATVHDNERLTGQGILLARLCAWQGDEVGEEVASIGRMVVGMFDPVGGLSNGEMGEAG